MAQRYTHSEVIVHFNPDCTDEFVTHDDYKALEDERDSWRMRYEASQEALSETQGELVNLTAELAECRKDVSRYRHVGIKYLGWLDVPNPQEGIEKDVCDPTMFDDADNATARTKA